MFKSNRGCYYRWDKKRKTSDYLRLSAHQVATALDPTRPSWRSWAWWRDAEKLDQIASIDIEVAPAEGGVRLHYKYHQQPVDPYLVRWAITTPRYGGQRYWWLCPACGRRCAYLYGGKIFACRRCHNLTYASAQSGDPRQERVERRLKAIHRRLGGDGGIFDQLPEKPPHMHLSTYMRLYWEYDQLLPIFWGELSLSVGLTDEDSDLPLAKLTDLAWGAYQRARTEPPADLVERILARLPDDEDEQPVERRRPVRRTLHQTAKAAEIPLDFAREAQQEGLLRPDAGRTTRRKRYRPKVASWLAKLHTLRTAGYTWEDLRAWTARRFLLEHEYERRWPAGYAPEMASA